MPPTKQSTKPSSILFSPRRSKASRCRPKASESSESIELTAADRADLVVSVEAMAWKLAKTAHRYFPQAGEIEDLVQAALQGAVIAANRFEAERGLKFLTYAMWWMRRELYTFCRLRADLVHTPNYVPQARTVQFGVNEEGESIEGLLPARRVERDPTEDAEQAARIADLLRCLPERVRFVIERRFGLDGFPPDKLEAVGQLLGLTRERVRQIETQAIKRLRRECA